MKIGILKEKKIGETRVAATPDILIKYNALGIDVWVEKNAGREAGFDDDSFLKAGAVIKENRTDIFQSADILLQIFSPDSEELKALKAGQIFISGYAPPNNDLQILCQTGATFFALERLPRLSRVQDMDILSSQNNLAGYKSALLALDSLNRVAPLMMTSAGTIPAAKALILGAGVAGLQAIATLKRMGVRVFASDVRAAVKEQIESLGAQFLDIDKKANFENATGYASETSAEYIIKQKERISEQLKQTDILITTALIQNKKPPLLVSSAMAESMPPNAVIVDISGANVEAPQKRPDIVFIQDKNMPARIPFSSSRFYARNIYNFITHFGGVSFAFRSDDEIMNALCLCFNGKIIEEKTK